jgi:hypothetical protein
LIESREPSDSSPFSMMNCSVASASRHRVQAVVLAELPQLLDLELPAHREEWNRRVERDFGLALVAELDQLEDHIRWVAIDADHWLTGTELGLLARHVGHQPHPHVAPAGEHHAVRRDAQRDVGRGLAVLCRLDHHIR